MSASVTVIVATYNPQTDKLINTLKSIITQKNVDVDIIVTDDGSKQNHFNEIRKFFAENNFEHYKLIEHEVNAGTCKNMEDAVNAAEGKYIKLISPGDYLYDENTLCDWVEFMEENHSEISFGDAVYYHMENNNVNVLKQLNHPQRLSLYDTKAFNFDRAKLNYILMCDTSVGATFMACTDIMKKYFAVISGKVKYAEDFMYKIMLADNVRLWHYGRDVIWYEYGIGISTGSNDKWAALIKKDQDAVDDIILERCSDKFTKKYSKYLSKLKKSRMPQALCKIAVFPSSFYWLLKGKIKKNYTNTQIRLDFIEKLLDK